jgi:hypothetical protein
LEVVLVIHCWILLLSRAGPEARRAPAVCTQLPPPIEPAQATTLQIGVTEGRATDVTRLRGCCSDGALHQAPGLAFEVEPGVLMRLAARNGGDALYKVKDALRLAILLLNNDFNDLRCLCFGEAILPQKALPILVGAGDDPCLAAATPATNGAGEELAKFVSAGVASWANRCAANFE